MSKKANVTLASDAPRVDMSPVLPLMAGAMKGLEVMATAREKARVACLAFADGVIATFGTLEVLTATARNKDATDAQKAAYTALKDAYLQELWGAAFCAWVDGEGKDTPKSPKRGQKAQPRAYWQQQKGAKWNKAGEGFVPKVLAFVAEEAERKAQASNGAGGEGGEGGEGAGEGRAPGRNTKAIDDACRDEVNRSIKRIEKAIADKVDMPPNVNVGVFLTFARLALDGLEKGKAPQNRADMALNALRAANILA